MIEGQQLRIFVVICRSILVNALVDVVRPSLSPSLEIRDRLFAETIGGELFVGPPLDGTQPHGEAFQAELIPGQAATQ